ncbi:MAG: histidine kinase [Gammaproteobacteria bacterium]
MSLRLRVALIIGVVIALLLLLAVALGLRGAERDSAREIASTTRLVLALLPDRFATAPDGPSALRAAQRMLQASALRDVRHVSIEIHAPDGALVWASRAPAADASVRPLLFRNAPVWDLPALRRDIRVGGTVAGHYLVRPNPADELNEVQDDFRNEALLTVAVAVALGVVLYWGMSAVLTPLVQVRQALARLESGDLKARLPGFALPELHALAASFNRTAGSLEEAVLERQRLMQKLVGLEDETRRSLARDLHDELGPYLVAMQPHARLIENACGQHDALARWRQSATSLREHVSHLLETTRHLLERLRPPGIEELGLREALTGLVQHWRQHAPRPVDIELHLAGDWQRFTPTLDVSIYRIVQECLTNAFKHSDADRIAVQVACAGAAPAARTVHLQVFDNGTRRAPAGPAGMGVLGMRERIQALGGTMSAGTAQDGGWRVEAVLPLGADERVAA